MGNNNYDEKGYVAKHQRIPYFPVAFEKGDGAFEDYRNGKIGDEIFEFAKGW